MAFSRALRAPTPLNSTDPQCAQWGDTIYSSAIRCRVVVVGAESARGAGGFGLAVTAQVGAAGFAGGFDLFVGSHVGLRHFHVLPGACYLTFVTLSESLVHNFRLHLR
jgi:hypothetical protein